MAQSKEKERELLRRSKARQRIIEHYRKVTRNVARTCRFFGVSRSTFYVWLRRFEREGVSGLRDRPRRPNMIRYQIPPHVIALILKIRREREYGAPRISLFLQRYHHVYVSSTTILKILKRHKVNRISTKRFRPGPRFRRDIKTPGESLQIDVKFVPKRVGTGYRFYQFTAIDEATRFRVLRIYDHNNVKNSIAFLDDVRRVFPVAIQKVQTDHGSEFGWDFTWHLRDLGIKHRRIPRGVPECNGKVERSHRTDSQEFYRHLSRLNPRQLVRATRRWEHEYNSLRPHLALSGDTPFERLHGALNATHKSVRDVS